MSLKAKELKKILGFVLKDAGQGRWFVYIRTGSEKGKIAVLHEGEFEEKSAKVFGEECECNLKNSQIKAKIAEFDLKNKLIPDKVSAEKYGFVTNERLLEKEAERTKVKQTVEISEELSSC